MHGRSSCSASAIKGRIAERSKTIGGCRAKRTGKLAEAQNKLGRRPCVTAWRAGPAALPNRSRRSRPPAALRSRGQSEMPARRVHLWPSLAALRLHDRVGRILEGPLNRQRLGMYLQQAGSRPALGACSLLARDMHCLKLRKTKLLIAERMRATRCTAVCRYTAVLPCHWASGRREGRHGRVLERIRAGCPPAGPLAGPSRSWVGPAAAAGMFVDTVGRLAL